MTDIEIPDNEDAACDMDMLVSYFARSGNYERAEKASGAARRLRADAEEIARLESELATAKTEAAAQRELATLLERESSDPLTRIAAALERPSREWVAAIVIAATCGKDLPGGSKRDWDFTWHDHARNATAAADALLAEMGGRGDAEV